MPHVVAEYARPVEREVAISDLLEALWQAGAGSGVMQPEDLKVRAVAYDHWRHARAGETFVHVTVSLLEGRTDAQKEGLAVALRAALVALLPRVESLSVDVRDMNATAYKKRLLEG